MKEDDKQNSKVSFNCTSWFEMACEGELMSGRVVALRSESVCNSSQERERAGRLITTGNKLKLEI